MTKLKDIVVFILLMSVLSGCHGKKTFLSAEIKSINPYKVGQKLTFISNEGAEFGTSINYQVLKIVYE